MDILFRNLFSTWWGILTVSLVSILIWIILSVLLYKKFFKRLYDIVLSGIALLILSPILVLLMIVGAIKMKGNPFFTQKRPGKNGKIFRLIKFRTMTNARDKNGDLLPDDMRLTRYGKILRSTSLDELPELFNIFVGNMSIVGPRPLLVEYLPYYTAEELHRHDVRPGLTGLAQVNGRNAISWDDKLSFDVKYVSNISWWMDFKIILETVFKVFKRADIQVGSEFKAGKFIDQRKQRMGQLAEEREQTEVSNATNR